MALFALFRAQNLLILLDEPEVHFNDVWKREIVNMLDQIMDGYVSHALITTHSSIALTDVSPESIMKLEREDGALYAVRPRIQTFAADPSDIMMHIFNAQHANGERSSRFIRTIEAQSDPAQLTQLMDMTAPGYWRYRIRRQIGRLS